MALVDQGVPEDPHTWLLCLSIGKWEFGWMRPRASWPPRFVRASLQRSLELPCLGLELQEHRNELLGILGFAAEPFAYLC